MSNYINGVCVVRKTDYWNKTKDKLLEKTRAQMEMNNKRNVAATYLPTYEAFTDDDFKALLKNNIKDRDEIGVWMGIAQPLVDRVNIQWRGKLGFDWVHTSNVCLLTGYTNEEKERLIDEIMNSFKEIFGYYPKTVAAWILDVYSVKYMTDKYGIDAVIICREQWGMDSMSPWGGPYYGGYYPCKNNIMCPAQTAEEQINTPVFRMYVNDPIYCYYEHMDEEFNGVPAGPQTQEPTWPTGQSTKWLKWIWECIFGEKNCGFSYFQLGHENSFGWDRVQKGRNIQHELLENYGNHKYKPEYICVGEMGRRFKEKYKKTPARVVGALEDWMELGNQSLWFNNSNYRINIFADKENVWIRDIHIFDESYKERYLTEPCEEHGVLYDNLPVMDGVRFAASDIQKPGFYFGKGYIKDYEQRDDACYVQIQTEDKLITLKFGDKKIEMSAQKDFELDFKYYCGTYHARSYIIRIDEKEIGYALRKKVYSVTLEDGRINDMVIKSENGKVTMALKK